MKILKNTSPIPPILSPFFLFSVILAFIIAMPLASAAYTGGRDVTLQWDESIDAPNLQSYRIYYYTTQGDVGSLNTADYALSYTLPGGTPIPINPLSDPKPITIDKSHTQITLRLDPSKNYYFAATAIDKQGLESVFTREVIAPAIPQSVAYTVTSVPSGRQVVVDGSTYTTPQVFNWLPGTEHTIGVTSPQHGCVGDSIPVSGLERSGGTEPYGDGAPDGGDVYGDVRDSACGDGVGESFRGGDVDVESRGDGGGGWPELVCGESGGDGDDGSGECGLCLCELDGRSCDAGVRGGRRGRGRDVGDGRAEVADGELQCGVHGDDGSRGVVGDGGLCDVHIAADVWVGSGVGSLDLCIITVTDEGG